MTAALRFRLWLLTIVSSAVLAGIYGSVTTSFDSAGQARAWLSFGMAVMGLSSVFLMPAFSRRWQTVCAIVLPALLLRLLVLPAAPSDDIHRYLWEGKLIEERVDPYAALADDPVTSPYRDIHWEQMNHRDRSTAYPPLALLTFSLFNRVAYDPLVYKAAFLLLDLALIGTVIALLHYYRRPLKWAAFYALSPLAIIAFAAEGHYDILMVLPLFMALLAKLSGRVVGMAVLLAIAIHFKLMAVVVVPFLLWKTSPRAWSAFILMLFLPVLLFVEQVPLIIEAVLQFGSGGSFNGSLYQLVRELSGGERHVAGLSTVLVYVIVYTFVVWRFLRREISAWSASAIVLSALVVLSPTVHFWYLLWFLPFAAIQPKASWLSLSITGSLYFLVWDQSTNLGEWALPVWARYVSWMPFFFLLIWEILGQKRLVRSSARLAQPTLNETVDITVVIPALNPGSHLEKALESLEKQSLQAREIIITDGGSSDGSVDMSRLKERARVVSSKPGRGIQIKTGVLAAKTEWVLILHADAMLMPQALERLERHLQNNPATIGGCLGQRFDRSSWGLILVEVLNELRAVFARTSFGDQAQFLHRPTAIQQNCLSEQPLMEDVELCDRLRAIGPLSYLGSEVIVSAAKWKPQSFWKRFGLVVKFFFRYRLMVWKPAAERKRLAIELAEIYYPKK